jgi:integral membrane sensor domain MASE1
MNNFPSLSHHAHKWQPNLQRQFTKLRLSRFLTENLFSFLLQYAGLMFSTLSTYPAPLWMASGTTCAFIFLRGYTILPGIWLGSFLAYFLTTFHWQISGYAATIYSLQAGVLLWLCYQLACPQLLFQQRKMFCQFIISATTITALASFALGFLHDASISTHHSRLTLWLANLNGILIFSTAIVTLDAYFPQIETLKKISKFLFTPLYGALLCCTVGLVFSKTPAFTLFFTLLTWPLLITLRLLFGLCGMMTGIFSLGFLLVFCAYLATPLFTTSFSSITLLFVEVILSVEITTELFILATNKRMLNS